MTDKLRVVSIGAAVQDVFLEGAIFKPRQYKESLIEQFELGTKNEVENVVFSTGGGATNASVTFARAGLDSWYLGSVGNDVAAAAVLDELKKETVNTDLVKRSKDLGTGYSLILLAPSGERTILTYRGASSNYGLSENDFKKLTRANWFYISSLSGDFKSLKVIVHFAVKHGIKIAINPGAKELSKHHDFLELMPHFTILSLNKDELEQLYGTADLTTLLHKANQHIKYVVVTDGPHGCYVADGKNIYKAGMYENVKVVDRAGAGDAFCSGFVCKIAEGQSTETAITYASANSTSVVSKIGAKTGILKSGARLHSMPMQVSPMKQLVFS